VFGVVILLQFLGDLYFVVSSVTSVRSLCVSVCVCVCVCINIKAEIVLYMVHCLRGVPLGKRAGLGGVFVCLQGRKVKARGQRSGARQACWAGQEVQGSCLHGTWQSVIYTVIYTVI
jgi:hypothetical protein